MSHYNKIRAWYGEVFDPIVNILNRVKVNNNLLTLMVFLFTCFSVFFLLTEQIYKAGACGILVFIFDVLGVQLFYLNGLEKSKDAILDSIVDRYSEILFFTGIMVFFIQTDDYMFVLFSFLTLIGSLMSSFIKLRAGTLLIEVEFGFIRRAERILIASFAMFLGSYVFGIFMFFTAVIANVTSFYLFFKLFFSDKKY